jgi:hypothetical protein
MPENEALELIAIYQANAINSFTVFLSLTFAYLTAAYVVGRVLSPFHTMAISGLYVASSMTLGTACVISTQAWAEIIASQTAMLDALALYRGGYWDVFVEVLMMAVLAVGIYFMFNVRRRDLSKNDEMQG